MLVPPMCLPIQPSSALSHEFLHILKKPPGYPNGTACSSLRKVNKVPTPRGGGYDLPRSASSASGRTRAYLTDGEELLGIS